MVVANFLTRAPRGKTIPHTFEVRGDAVDNTTRLDKMIIRLAQQNAK